MEIPVVIHKDEASVYGVTVPDIPGCHSWGETIDNAMRNARDAIYSHVETLQELGESVAVVPSQIEQLSKDAGYAGGVWALVDIDPARLDSKPERINISLPRFVLSKIDAYVGSRHETRSGFLARAALRVIADETARPD